MTERHLQDELTKEFGTIKAENAIDKSIEGKWKIIIDGIEYIVDAGTSTENDEPIIPTEITASTVALSPTTYYGSTVNYTNYSSGYSGGWKIFYSDRNNIFLIASDYVPNTYLPSDTGRLTVANWNNYIAYWDYSNGEAPAQKQDPILNVNLWNRWTNYDDYYNSKCVSALLKTSDWSNFVNTTYADYAIGGPTLKMFCESWNAKGYEEITCENSNNYGYYTDENSITANVSADVGSTDTLYFVNRYDDDVYGYWLATPSADDRLNVEDGEFIWGIDTRYKNVSSTTGDYYTSFGCRPVVCLKSEIKLIESSIDGTYDLDL